MSAEYVLSQGNRQVILCERGIKTFETALRYTLDGSAVPVAKMLSHLPVIVDPSHAAGDRQFVPALARAGIAAGADGIMVECHDCPSKAMCDGPQALLPETFAALMKELRRRLRACWDESSRKHRLLFKQKQLYYKVKYIYLDSPKLHIVAGFRFPSLCAKIDDNPGSFRRLRLKVEQLFYAQALRCR